MKNEIVTVLTPVGEIIGKYVEQTEDYVVLDNPRLAMQTAQGYGFANAVTPTASESVKEAKIRNYVLVVEVSKGVADAYRQAVTGLVTASANSIIGG